MWERQGFLLFRIHTKWYIATILTSLVSEDQKGLKQTVGIPRVSHATLVALKHMYASGFINVTGNLEAGRQNVVSQLMHWTVEGIVTLVKIDHLSVIKVFS